MTARAIHESVVVATDGTPAALHGVKYAAFEAKRLGLGLEVLHVVPGYLPTGPLPMIPDGSLQQFGSTVLVHSVEAARSAVEDLHVVSRLVSGARVHSIVEAASDAPLLVLGSRAATLAERLWTGATVAGVCSRAKCPVVVVPEEWPVRDAGAMSRIVVGFKSPQHAVELLASAFTLARSRGAEVVVLHAWKLPSVYDDVVTARVEEKQWGVEQRAVVESVLAQVRPSYPEVKVSIEVVHDRPGHALAEASRDSDRLIITRPVHGGYLHHLGAAARAVLREAHCPVEVLPPVTGNGEVATSMPEHGALHTQSEIHSMEPS